MPTFKPKSSKTIQVCSKSTTTLDSKHRELLEKITQDEEELPKLRNEKSKLKKALKKESNIEKVLDIQDKIKTLSKKIKTIKRAKKEYFLDNSQYVFKYFENKKNIAEGKNKTRVLNHFFNIGTEKPDNNKDTTTNVQKYLANVDENFLDMDNFIVSTDVCPNCHKGELIAIDHEGMLVCNNCSASFQFLIENEKPSYKEPPKEVCFYAYKRINHFREILAQVQAIDTTQIPDVVLENIKIQIKKEN